MTDVDCTRIMIYYQRFLLSFLSLMCTSGTLAQLSVPITVKGVRGSGAVLTCVYPAQMLTTPTISWEKRDGIDIVPVATSVSGIPHISGPMVGRASLNGANLTISPLKILDSGTYTCKVIGVGIPSESASTNLVVTAVPSVNASIIKSPSILANGKYAAATCVANAGEPRATIQWTNEAGLIQDSRESESSAEDGSWDVESMLFLTPGLLGRLPNSTVPISFEEKRQMFICHISHEDLVTAEQRTRKVTVDVLYPPQAFISLLSNRLTCQVEGNPTPTLKWLLPNGDIIIGNTDIYIPPTASENGRYTCMATSGLDPDALSTLDVQKAQDLPSLFRTLVRLETSLPITALGYEIACLAEIEDSKNGARGLSFQWTRNEKILDEDSYKVTTTLISSNSTRATLSSTLLFADVLRGRDDATFRCRFVNTSQTVGFVTAVERSVRLSIDYPPSDAIIVGQPNDFIVLEGKELTLRCAAESQPSSTYKWYFNGELIATNNSVTFATIDRNDAGDYRCLAYNYVPGSVHADITVTVQYPPSDVVIVALPSHQSLSCVARSGSIPPPIYTWLYPNQTYSRGNLSTIRLLSDYVSAPSVYVCVVSNNLGYSANTTFIQLPPAAVKIGALSLPEFIVTIVTSAIIVIGISVFVGWILYRRRRKMVDSKKLSAEETFKRYLQYTEPPESGAPIAKRETSASSCDPTVVMQHRKINDVSCDEITPTKEVNHTAMKLSDTNNDKEECPTRLTSPISYTRSPLAPVPSRNKKYRSCSDFDGGSTDIAQKESLPSFKARTSTNDPDMQMGGNESCRSPANGGSSRDTESQQYRDTGRGSTLPYPARLAHIRQDVARHMQAQALIPMQYFPQGTVPRMSQSNAPVRIHQHHPVGLVIPGYNPVLYDETWQTGIPRYPRMEGETGQYPPRKVTSRRPTAINEASTLSETTSASTDGSEDYLHGSRTSDPRSLSLSASYSSSGSFTPSYLTSEANTQKGNEAQSLGGDLIPLKNITSSRTASPFDSGNDSAKSTQATTKPTKQSMTLV